MIINFIITALLGLTKAIMSILPTVPPTPAQIVSGGAWVTDTIADVIGVLRLFYGEILLNAFILIFGAILIFEWAYHGIMWIIRKIPMINIK